MKKIGAILVAALFFSLIWVPKNHLAQASEGQTFEEINILMISREYNEEYQGIKDRNSIQDQFKYIFTPGTINEIIEIIHNLERKFRIRRMVFLGHGDPGGGIVNLVGDLGFNTRQLEEFCEKFRKDGDSSLLDAFAENAEIVYFNCSVAKDPYFLPTTAKLFLAFSGGTVYGSDELVFSQRSTEGTLISWLSMMAIWNRGIGRESVNFTSPSQVDYRKFKSYTIEPFLQRDFATRQKVEINGPDFATANVNDKVALRAILPDRQSIPSRVLPFLKFRWQLIWPGMVEGKERIRRKIVEDATAEPDTSALTTCAAHLELCLDNGIGRRKLGEADLSLLIRKPLDVTIELSVKDPDPGKIVSARAHVKEGDIPEGAMWGWTAQGAVQIVTRSGETVQFKTTGKGQLAVDLYTKVYDKVSVGKTRIWGTGSIPIEPKPGPTPPEPDPKDKTAEGTKEAKDKGIPDTNREVPPDSTPPGVVPPSSGNAAGGYWKLTKIMDDFDVRKHIYISSATGTPTVTFSGATLTSRLVGTYEAQNNPPGAGTRREPIDYRQITTWTDPPKAVAPNVTYSTTLKTTTSPEKAAGDPFGEITMQISSMGHPIKVGEKVPTATDQWYMPPMKAGIAPYNVSIQVNGYGPGGYGRRYYSYEWTPGAMPAGAAATAGDPTTGTAFSVEVASDRPKLILGDTVTLSAKVTGGTAPYAYAWTGAASGVADKLAFTADKPGTQAFTVTVSDSKGATATASASVKTEGLNATIRRTSTGPIVLGQSIGFQAQLSAAGQPAAGAFVYRWQPHPEVTYAPFEDAGTQTTAVFTRLGRTRVWVEVLRKEGPVLATVAESEQIEIDVVGPQLSLTANPSTPYPGQEVRINVTMNPAILDKYVTFLWEIQGNALNAAPVVVGDAYSRAYTYKPKDTAPVTVTVHGKAKDGGDDLGQKSLAVTARPYEVKIGEPRLMGPPPRVWSEQAKGLVEVPRAIGTFQDFYVNASVSPPPPDSSLRYEWKSQPEGCTIYSPGSQEPRGNAGQAGTFNLSVTVRDSQGITLGSGERTVSIVAPAPEPKKSEPVKPPSKTAEAMAKLKEASALAAEGKLDEAIAAADEASALDPNSKPIASYTQQLKVTKIQLTEHLNNVRSLGQKGSFEDASAELAKAKELVPNSPLVAAAEAQLRAVRRQKAVDLLNQAKSLYQQDKLNEALEKASEASISDTSYSDAYRYLTNLEKELDQKLTKDDAERKKKAKDEEAKAAEANKAEAAKITSNQAAAQVKLKEAKDLAKQEKYEEAYQLADEAARMDPGNTAASNYRRVLQAVRHLSKATTLGQQDKFDEAFAEVATAKEIDPTNKSIAKVEEWLKQTQEFQRAAQKAAEEKKAQAAKQKATEAKARDDKMPPHIVRGADGKLRPAPGYEWVSDDPNNKDVIWKPGQPHPEHTNVVAGETEGQFKPAPGYRWVSKDSDDKRVVPTEVTGGGGGSDEAKQKAVEDRAAAARAREEAARAADQKAAEARAREEAAKAAAEEKKRQEPPPEPQGCSLSGEWELFKWGPDTPSKGFSFTYSLHQTGKSLAGTHTEIGVFGSNTWDIKGSVSGRDFRITVSMLNSERVFVGSVSADCQTLNGSDTFLGDTAAVSLRRR